MKRAYLISMVFSIVFLFAFVVLLFLFDEPLVRVGVIAMIIAYVAFSWMNLSAYRRVRVDFPMDGNLRNVLQNTYDFIVANIKYQERFGLFVYPFAAAAGYLMGLSASTGNATERLEQQLVLVVLAIVIVVLTPLSWLAARWLYKLSYGKCLVELKALISEMDKPFAL
ncbi:MAG: hypothetical protein ACOYW3_14190 [Bacteroidota bacterium]